MRRLLFILCLLLFASPARALEEFVTLQFQVDPPQAEVYLEGSAENVRKETPRAAGRAGQKILVERAKYPTGELVVTFRAEGYHDLTRTFALSNVFRNLDQAVLPNDGSSIVMVPRSRNWWAIGLAVGLTVAGLGALGRGILVWKGSRGKIRDMEKWVASNIVPSGEEDPLLGKRLGPYWIVEKLGRGGMAMVYRAARAEVGSADEEVAIKVVHSHLAEQEDFRARFRREVGISTSLIYPNIVTVYDAGVEEGRYFIAMELVRGRDLRSHIPEGGFPLAKAIAYLAPVFRAVAYAHGKGVVHRDLKPENVLVTEDGQVKLNDFGLARSQKFSTVTATGSILGTPGYMAPEQIGGKAFEPATDQYALGVMTFELCTGRLPFEGEDVMQVIMQHLNATPPSPSSLRPDLPHELDGLVARMLAKQPADRYASVLDALAALERLA